MKLVSFSTPDGPRAGLLREGRVFDIWGEAFAHVRAADRTIFWLLQGGLLGEVESVEDEGVPVEGLELLPPIARPGRLICIGLNYREHAEEQGKQPPRRPPSSRSSPTPSPRPARPCGCPAGARR